MSGVPGGGLEWRIPWQVYEWPYDDGWSQNLLVCELWNVDILEWMSVSGQFTNDHDIHGIRETIGLVDICIAHNVDII